MPYVGVFKIFMSFIGKCFMLSEMRVRLFTFAVAAIKQSVKLKFFSCFTYCCQYKPACFAIDFVTSHVRNSSKTLSVFSNSEGKIFLYISAIVTVDIENA